MQNCRVFWHSQIRRSYKK